MNNIAKVRSLLSVLQGVALYLTDEEISEIAKVVEKAITKLESEE